MSVSGRGAIFLGPSGAGKSALALQLLALGAGLVADDRTKVIRRGDQLIADTPESIRGLIEARHVGILRMQASGKTPLSVVVDLSRPETERLPPPRFHEILGVSLPCLHRVEGAHFAASILLYLQCSIDSAP